MSVEKVIGFCGRKESGKSLLASTTEEFYKSSNTVHVISFDIPLKKLVAKLINISIETLEKAKNENVLFEINFDKNKVNMLVSEIINGEHKDYTESKLIVKTSFLESIINENLIYPLLKKRPASPFNVCEATVRYLLQTIGTDIIRTYNSDWHINQLVYSIKNIEGDNNVVIVPDIRFENEYHAVKELTDDIFYVLRPDNLKVSNHISDITIPYNLYKLFMPKRIIINNYPKEDLIEEWNTYLKKGDCTLFDETSYWMSQYFHKLSDGEKEMTSLLVKGQDGINGSKITFKLRNRKTFEIVQKNLTGNIKTDEYILEIDNPYIVEEMKLYF